MCLRIGFIVFFVFRKNLLLSWPALASWGIAIAIALTLEKTGTLHLFFLFVPVWIITSALYTIFAAIAGARESLPELIDDAPARVWKTEAKAEAKTLAPANNTILWISGGVALACLMTCFVLPLWVFLAGTTGYDERLALFQKILIVPTLIYFVAGTTFVIKRDTQKTN